MQDRLPSDGVHGNGYRLGQAVDLGQAFRCPYDPCQGDIFPEYLIKLRCVNGGSGREQRRTAVIGPARRSCCRNARAFQRHFAGSLPCSSPPCAELPAASHGLHQGRSPLWHPAPWLTMTGLVSSERTSCLPELIGPVGRAGLPLNEHRSGDQQHKKDWQQYRGHEPLANTEFEDSGHIGRLLVAAGAQCSQSPMTAGKRAVIWKIW